MGKRKQQYKRPSNSEESRDEGTREDWERYKNGVVVAAKTQTQKQYIVAIKNNDITFCVGPAGTGKTAIAVGMALQGIACERPQYEKLVVLRPAKEACDESIGFLPGSLDEKMMPWAAPIMDNMLLFIMPQHIKRMLMFKTVEIVPLAYARGRTFNKSFIILDEAQNCSDKQLLMVLTRIGEGSKLVINGDLKQSDIRGKSGLIDAMKRLDGMACVAKIEMTDSDIVRHPLIAEILKRYDN